MWKWGKRENEQNEVPNLITVGNEPVLTEQQFVTTSARSMRACASGSLSNSE